MKIYNIDGPDGVGKSTLVDGLTKHFRSQNKAVAFIHFPRYDTAIGTLIRESLFIRTQMDPKSLQMLYSADRLNFTKFEVSKLESMYDILIVDRYITSGLVYGAVDGLDPQDILCFDRETIKPDLNIILLAPAEVLMQRMSGKEKDKYETLENQKTAIDHYASTHTYFPKTVYIDAEKPASKVLEDTKFAINHLG